MYHKIYSQAIKAAKEKNLDKDSAISGGFDIMEKLVKNTRGKKIKLNKESLMTPIIQASGIEKWNPVIPKGRFISDSEIKKRAQLIAKTTNLYKHSPYEDMADGIAPKDGFGQPDYKFMETFLGWGTDDFKKLSEETQDLMPSYSKWKSENPEKFKTFKH